MICLEVLRQNFLLPLVLWGAIHSTSAQSFQLEKLWELPAGSRPYLNSSNALERGLAYNPITDHVLLVSRISSPELRGIQILDGASGTDLGQLKTNGITGGTFVLSKIGVADDGAIYAANFGTYSLVNPFKVYRWADENATPSLAYSGDPGNGNNQQWGNAMAVRRTGINTEILLPTRGSVVAVLKTSNGTTFSSTVLATDAPAGAFYQGIAFGPGNTFYGKTNGGPLYQMRFDLNAKTATTLKSFGVPDFPLNISSLAVDSRNSLLAGIAAGTPDAVNLYDLSNPAGPPILTDLARFPTANENSLYQGALDFHHAGKLFALDANNGVMAFRVHSPARLKTASKTNQITLSWPVLRQTHVLESFNSLPPDSRTIVTQNVATSNGQTTTSFSTSEPKSFYRLRKTIRLMTYNIHHGEGVDGTLDLARIAAVITNAAADVVGLQEVDRLTTRASGRDEIAELAALTGMDFYFGKNIPYQGGEYGNAILSRFPIRKQVNTLLTRLDTSVEQRGVAQVVLDIHGSELVFLVTHLDAGSSDAERLNSIPQLRNIAQSYGNRSLILCGDFNATPSSPVYTEVKRTFADLWVNLGAGNGYTSSSPFPTRRIDYIWTALLGRVDAIKASVPQSLASDHLPVVMEVIVPVNALTN